MIRPMFARYVRPGMTIAHPTLNGSGVIREIRYAPPAATPGRPWGTVSGWMSCPKSECRTEREHSHGFTYPAETLLLVRA